MKLIYMAHPVAGDVAGNVLRAKAWLKFLIDRYEGTHMIIAPWITECEVFDESEEGDRERALRRCKAVIERCDEIWLVGERASAGMWEEWRHANEHGVGCVNLTGVYWEGWQ